MQLDKVTAEIRPRGRWESIDLGCALVRENYGKIMAGWFSTVVPLWLIIIGIFQLWPYPEGRPWMAGLACLWILPACRRVPLYVLSRRLFGEDVFWKELLRVFPKMLFRRFFTTLFFGPFNLKGCLSQPVSELEGLKGKAYRERVSLLARNGGEGAVQAGIISLLLVLATMLSFMFATLSVLGLFGDNVELEKFWLENVSNSDADFMPVPVAWACVGFLLSAITLIEPFYVGAGFAMYINSRTITEGWDIELAFKRMNARVAGVLDKTSKSIFSVGLGFVLLGMFSSQAEASNPRLDEVMAHEDFVIETEIVEVPVYKPKERSDLDWTFVGIVAEIIFWFVVVVLAVGLFWLIYNNRHVFSRNKLEQSSPKLPKVTSVMGMEVAPESLPTDVVEAARAAWDRGDHQLALSLLYRGAISWLVHEADVQIEESDTEQDCVDRVSTMESPEAVQYFTKLTGHWVALAYGSTLPENAEVVWLCNAWPYQAKKLESQPGGMR